MKRLRKKLILNKKTIDILDEKALQDLKGGLSEVADKTCIWASCVGGGTGGGGGGGGGGKTCLWASCASQIIG